MKSVISALAALMVFHVLIGAAIGSVPLSTITANNSATPQNLDPNDVLSIKIEMDPKDYQGIMGDSCIAAYTPLGWFYYDAIGGSWSRKQGLSVSYQGPLFALGPLELLSIRGLPKGHQDPVVDCDTFEIICYGDDNVTLSISGNRMQGQSQIEDCEFGGYFEVFVDVVRQN